MDRYLVSIVRYSKPYKSVKKAVELSNGLKGLSPDASVFIKPNVVFWSKAVDFPKWGVITTSRVVHDMVVVLKEHGVRNITLGEGIVTFHPKDRDTPSHAFETLGYNELSKRYGVKVINVFDRPFKRVDLGGGISLNFNQDAIESDFIVNLPVLKTHAQAVVSLGIKNLKGLIDINSRKRCHSADPVKDLNFMISKLADKMPPMFTLIDGIYTIERGPAYDGKARRSDLLVASNDVYSADKVGAKLLGYEPADITYIRNSLMEKHRSTDLTDVHVIGERIEDVASFHQYEFPYGNDNSLPIPLIRMGIKGLSYPKYDSTLCTYCSGLNGVVLYAIARAWKGQTWDGVEILTGKRMRPSGKMNKTILLGKCMYKLNKDSPDIKEMIAVKGCPPEPSQILSALRQAGIDADPSIILEPDKYPALFMAKYQWKREFEESFFRVE